VRHALERNPVPSISFLDSQPVTTTAAGRERSYDKKKINRRKRQCWVDANSFLLQVLAPLLRILDVEGIEWFLAAHHQSFLRNARDSGRRGQKRGLDAWMQKKTVIRLNISKKPPEQKGYAVTPKRWLEERLITWAGRNLLERKTYNRTYILVLSQYS